MLTSTPFQQKIKTKRRRKKGLKSHGSVIRAFVCLLSHSGLAHERSAVSSPIPIGVVEPPGWLHYQKYGFALRGNARDLSTTDVDGQEQLRSMRPWPLQQGLSALHITWGAALWERGQSGRVKIARLDHARGLTRAPGLTAQIRSRWLGEGPPLLGTYITPWLTLGHTPRSAYNPTRVVQNELRNRSVG